MTDEVKSYLFDNHTIPNLLGNMWLLNFEKMNKTEDICYFAVFGTGMPVPYDRPGHS